MSNKIPVEIISHILTFTNNKDFIKNTVINKKIHSLLLDETENRTIKNNFNKVLSSCLSDKRCFSSLNLGPKIEDRFRCHHRVEDSSHFCRMCNYIKYTKSIN